MTYSSTQTSSSVWEVSWRWRYLLSLLAKLFNQKLVQDLLHCGGRIIMEHGPRSSCLPKLQALTRMRRACLLCQASFFQCQIIFLFFLLFFPNTINPFPTISQHSIELSIFEQSLLNYNFKGHVTRVTMKDRGFKYI